MSDAARFWEEQSAGFDDAPDHGLRDAAIRSAWASLILPLMPPPPARIADLGCGTGSLAVLVAEAGHVVSGVDVAAGMITRARGKAAAAGVHADFEVGDATAPPWPRATFDVVMARHVVWALPDPGLALDRWLGLLRHGGRLVLIEGSLVDRSRASRGRPTGPASRARTRGLDYTVARRRPLGRPSHRREVPPGQPAERAASRSVRLVTLAISEPVRR